MPFVFELFAAALSFVGVWIMVAKPTTILLGLGLMILGLLLANRVLAWRRRRT